MIQIASMYLNKTKKTSYPLMEVWSWRLSISISEPKAQVYVWGESPPLTTSVVLHNGLLYRIHTLNTKIQSV